MRKRTGLKILYWKIKKFLTYPYNFTYKEDFNFPEKSGSVIKFLIWLHTLKNEVGSRKLKRTLGFLHNEPLWVGNITWKTLLPLNPNNLGDWVRKKALIGTENAEKSLIHKMINLLGGKASEWSGYATTGATESNIYSAWVGRNYLSEKIKGGKICMILNELTHYSIKKAANIVNVPIVEVVISRKSWKVSVEDLEKEIVRQSTKGYKGFLIPLTLGYTQTGINDDYEKISELAARLERKLKIKIFIWIDAAINGLILPFSKHSFYPLKSGINTLALDFHKTGMCPIPSGLVIFKKELMKYATQKVQYLDQDDTTLLGSRSGISPAAMYAVIEYLGRSGFRNAVEKAVQKKEKFQVLVKVELPEIEIINEEGGTALGIVSKKALPEAFVKKHGLFSKRWRYFFKSGSEVLYVYKVNFLPTS